MKIHYSHVSLFVALALGLTWYNSSSDNSANRAQLPISKASPISQVIIPTLAYDENSVVLTWHKPDDYTNITDYRVYQNGTAIGLASENNNANNPAKPYIDKFYAADTDNFQHQVTFQNFKVTGLSAGMHYQFTVAAIYADGSESEQSPAIAITTPSYTKTVDVTEYGAKGDGITLNTVAIQAAIDACAEGSTSAYGCHLVLPGTEQGAVYMSGALFLRSNMTLEVEAGATLKGSDDAAQYPLHKGYQLYSYETHVTDSRRPPSLLNAIDEAHMNTTNGAKHGYNGEQDVFENIRVVGAGTLDGNGWMRDTDAPDTIDEAGNKLPYFTPGSRSKVYDLGILAKNQLLAAYREYGKEVADTDPKGQFNRDMYVDRRSSLATFRGVTNMYFAGLTLTNPAYHGVMFLEGKNLVFAYTSTQTFDINNADGVEFGNSKSFKVFANFIDSGDDCINFAAGQGTEYENGNATQDGWVFNNYTREGHGVLVAGSHTGAGIKNILAEDNVAFLTDNGLRLKSTAPTGGGAWNITFRDTAMRNIALNMSDSIDGTTVENRGGKGNPFVVTLSYKAGDNVFSDAKKAASFHDITVQNVTLDNVDPNASGKQVIKIDGYDGSDSSSPYPATFHSNILFNNVALRNVKNTSIKQLKDSTFNNVSIVNAENAETFWNITGSQNLTFTKVAPPWSGNTK